MTEEEKKAIETLQYLCSDDCINKDIIKIIVNLIEKLKKENEELKKQKVEYLDKIYNKIDNLKYEYKKAAMHYEPERASFYRDLIRHFKILLEED